MVLFSFTFKERRSEGLSKISNIPRVIPRCHVRWCRAVLVSGSTNSINDGAYVMLRLNRWSDSAPITLSINASNQKQDPCPDEFYPL